MSVLYVTFAYLATAIVIICVISKWLCPNCCGWKRYGDDLCISCEIIEEDNDV